MLIDWFTVVAQAVNFLVLVWLLKRFLYKPVLEAIDGRDQRITTQLREAGRMQAEAQQERAELQRRNEELDRNRELLMGKALADAKAEGQRLSGEARQAAEALRSRLEEAMTRDREVMAREVTSRVQHEVLAIVRQTLSDLASTGLEEQMTGAFIRRLHDLGGDEKASLAASLRTGHRPVLVRTAFELPPDQRQAIVAAVKEALGSEPPLQFETSPALVCGVELSTDGLRVGWSIADHLASFERGLDDALGVQHASDR